MRLRGLARDNSPVSARHFFFSEAVGAAEVGDVARVGLLERIPLTPEGVTIDEAIRGIDIALDDGLPVLVFSFHSPSLSPGNTPYVPDEDALDTLYDWWRRVFAYLAQRGVAPTSVAEIMRAVELSAK